MLAPPSDSVTLPDRIDPRITTDPHWTALAAPLDRASANGTDVPAILRAIASEQRDFADQPARSLSSLVADKAPDLGSPHRLAARPNAIKTRAANLHRHRPQPEPPGTVRAVELRDG